MYYCPINMNMPSTPTPLARNEQLGLEALKSLQTLSSSATLKFHQLDITDQRSIDTLRDHIRNAHGGLDILINNAGIAYKVCKQI